MMKFSELNAAKNADCLVPAIVQDAESLQVLMLGYMNAEAYDKTIATGRVTFWSRTRRRLWTKGEESGNWLEVVAVSTDCDADTLLVKAIAHGPTCHTGARNCFGTDPDEGFVRRLWGVVQQRRAEMPDGSYTTRLFESGVARIAQKVGEEAIETVIEAVAGRREGVLYEASDLVFHLLVLLRQMDIEPADIERELAGRHK